MNLIDRIILENKELTVLNYRLIDAMVIRTDGSVISQKELEHIADQIVGIRDRHAQALIERESNPDYQPVKLEPEQDGAIEIAPARAPYDNIAFETKEAVFWLVVIDESAPTGLGEMRKYGLIFLHADGRRARMDFYQNKENYHVDLNEFYFKNVDGSICSHNSTEKAVFTIWAFVCLKLCAIMTCCNVRLERVDPSPSKNRRRVKRGNLPLMSYHIIVVNENRVSTGGTAQDLWNNRLHLCRGHFKRYTAEKPLFGKFVGLYWWQPQVRGRNLDGMVVKHYETESQVVN